MSEKIKVALMTHPGGAHLSAYYTALKQTEEVSQVVLSDPDGKHEQAARKVLGDKLAKAYRNHAEMLAAEKPQMALITMEAVLAPPVIELALESGCHVYAEKPACVRAADFEKLTQLADSKHKHLMLALANRIQPPMVAAQKLIRTGKLGKLFGLEMHLVADQTRLKQAGYQKSWLADRSRAGGGHLTWLGIHWLDLAMFITGESVEKVAGFAGIVGGQPIKIEDSAVLSFQMTNGSFGTMTSGYYLDRGYHSHMKIWGADGWLELDPFQDVPLKWYSRKEKSLEIQNYTGPKDPKGYTPFVREAVRAAAGLQEPPISNADSLRVLKTIFAFYHAAETGQTQSV